ncbi:hypothetical protein KAI60_02500, partial [Candidatus Bathyarchaeota archaeon]|nr:hypothetical protein [Candidatus Bathyarchaeota archaeon]
DSKKILIVILITIIGAESLSLLQTYNNYDQTNTAYQILTVQYLSLLNETNTLQNNYTNLQSSYGDLQTNFTDIQNSYYTLNTFHQLLSQDKAQLETDYDSLVDEHTYLSLSYAVERCLRIGNSLGSYYDYLRQELGPTGTENWWRETDPNYWQTSVDFATNLALHDISKIYWPAIEEDYYEAVGEYSYDTASAKIQEVLSLIEIQTYDSATVAITKILAFINKYIHYELEVNDVFLAPVETLGYKSGDCDDFSILVASILDNIGIESAIGFFVNEYDQYHAMILVNLADLEGYGYYYHEDLTQNGLDPGRWIIIEPQATIETQDTSWIEQWTLFAVSELEV